MKAVFVSNQQFIRRLGLSATIVFELGKPLLPGDILADVVTEHEFVVSARGFPPRRSTSTSCRLHWSREASVTFKGKCDEIDGRVLFAGDVSRLRCLIIKGRIEEKNQPLPVETPIVGAARLTTYDCPAILKIDTQLQTELVVLGKSETEIEANSLDYVCVSPEGALIEVRLTITSVNNASEAGRLLNWREVDAPIVMC